MAGGAGRRRPGEVFGERFTLFAECLLLGVLIAVFSLPLVTWPAAFAAGCRSLEDATDGGRISVRRFGRDLWAALPGGAAVAVAGFALVAFLLVDLRVARSGLPGGGGVAVVLVAVIVLTLVAQLRAAALWAPGRRWRLLLRAGAAQTVRDPAGTALLAGALAVVAVVTWQLPPLLFVVLGPLALAAVAVRALYDRSRTPRS